jgi:hypothetical protein
MPKPPARSRHQQHWHWSCTGGGAIHAQRSTVARAGSTRHRAEDALDVVFVAAMLELLTAADATPANAITAMAIRDFFMIIPLNSEFSDN